MFNLRERRLVELKAIEQAFLQAQVAQIEVALLLPAARSTWPFELTDVDVQVLRVNKIDPR